MDDDGLHLALKISVEALWFVAEPQAYGMSVQGYRITHASKFKVGEILPIGGLNYQENNAPGLGVFYLCRQNT